MSRNKKRDSKSIEDQMKVKNYYNAFSDGYDRFYHDIQIQKFLALQDIILPLKIISMVDLGGGTGLFAEWLDEPIITVDLSYDMLHSGLANQRTFLPIAGDMVSLPFRKQVFRSVISFTVFQNIRMQEVALSEIYRTSTTESISIITVLEKKFEESIFKNLHLEDVNLQSFPLEIEDIAIIIHK
jgi:ubiquinone/menaquinone biosynthesis C-methylase UbiE